MKMPDLKIIVIEIGGEFWLKPRWEYIKSDTRVWRRFGWGYISIAKDITPPDFEPAEHIL